MCGLVGMAGDLSLKDRELFEDMLDVCQLRGRDSTGAIRVSRQGDEYTWAKRLGPPTYLFDSREYEQNIRKMGISALIGHCRHATVGGVKQSAAHPFDVEEHGVIGVHNGTLKNFYRFPEHHHGMTDSQVLYERIGAKGPEATFSDLEGAWACVWWDANTQRLNFIRNNERPLYFTYSEDKRRMFWASEPWMFGAVYRKEKLWDGGEEKKVYISLAEDTLYQIEINANAPAGKPVFKVSEGKKIQKKAQSSVVVGFPNGTPTSTNSPTSTTSPKSGGEVTSPFLNDELPHHLTVPAKQPETTTKSTTTQPNSNNSSNPSKPLSVPSMPLKNIMSSCLLTNSQAQDSSKESQKTNRKKLSVVSAPSPESGSKTTIDLGKIYQANMGVDIRYIRAVDTEYITDLRTGREVDEHVFRNETGGKCCHCNEDVLRNGGLKMVAEIFDKGKRFICVDCVTPKPEPMLELIKEIA